MYLPRTETLAQTINKKGYIIEKLMHHISNVHHILKYLFITGSSSITRISDVELTSNSSEQGHVLLSLKVAFP